MNGIKELWPLFFIVAILGTLVGTNVLQNRPTPEAIKEIHEEMKLRRDSFQTAFNAMSFDAEVLENQTMVRKYPMPDVRYKLSIKHNSPFHKPDTLAE